jgi:Ca2+-transporting ATPase
MLLAVAIGLPTPFTAVMILWANLIVDVPPAMALGIDPAEPDVLSRKPRHPKAGVFNWKSIGVVLYQGFIMAGLTLGLYAIAIYVESYDEVSNDIHLCSS